HLLKKKQRELFRLVGADGEAVAGAGEVVEHGFDIRIEAGFICDMQFVMTEKGAYEILEPRFRDGPAARLKSALDQRARAVADHMAQLVRCDGGQILERQD